MWQDTSDAEGKRFTLSLSLGVDWSGVRPLLCCLKLVQGRWTLTIGSYGSVCLDRSITASQEREAQQVALAAVRHELRRLLQQVPAEDALRSLTNPSGVLWCEP